VPRLPPIGRTLERRDDSRVLQHGRIRGDPSFGRQKGELVGRHVRPALGNTERQGRPGLLVPAVDTDPLAELRAGARDVHTWACFGRSADCSCGSSIGPSFDDGKSALGLDQCGPHGGRTISITEIFSGGPAWCRESEASAFPQPMRHRASKVSGLPPMSPSRAASPRTYQFPDASPAVMIDCVAWVEEFGSELGAVILGRHSKPGPVRAPSRERGQYCSLIDEDSYPVLSRGRLPVRPRRPLTLASRAPRGISCDAPKSQPASSVTNSHGRDGRACLFGEGCLLRDAHQACESAEPWPVIMGNMSVASTYVMPVGDLRRPLIGRVAFGTLLASAIFFIFTATKQSSPV
jgi:hypothetical protein